MLGRNQNLRLVHTFQTSRENSHFATLNRYLNSSREGKVSNKLGIEVPKCLQDKQRT